VICKANPTQPNPSKAKRSKGEAAGARTLQQLMRRDGGDATLLQVRRVIDVVLQIDVEAEREAAFVRQIQLQIRDVQRRTGPFHALHTAAGAG
jgi:hypothetical protein